MAIAFVKKTFAQNPTGTTTVSMLATSTGGNTLILQVASQHFASTAQTVTSVTDSAGNTWTVAAAAGSFGTQYGAIAGAYCVGAAAVTSVTANFSTAVSTTTVYLSLTEFSGVPPTAATDGAASSVPAVSSTTVTSPAITTTAATGIVAATAFNADNQFTSISAGYTDAGAAGLPDTFTYQIITSPGTQSCTFTDTSSTFIYAALTFSVGVAVMRPLPALNLRQAVRRASLW